MKQYFTVGDPVKQTCFSAHFSSRFNKAIYRKSQITKLWPLLSRSQRALLLSISEQKPHKMIMLRHHLSHLLSVYKMTIFLENYHFNEKNFHHIMDFIFPYMTKNYSLHIARAAAFEASLEYTLSLNS